MTPQQAGQFVECVRCRQHYARRDLVVFNVNGGGVVRRICPNCIRELAELLEEREPRK